ncbi:MAG: YdeI/OmpD-associated family protein [Clostridia bacterium]|nr:YdeI/OmpD-associated family protein [Clostridia bacterium]
MKIYAFDTILKKHENMDAAYIEFPYDVEKEFGTKGQVKVSVTFDGYAYKGSLAKMGLPRHCLGVTKEVRKAIGKNPGDTVHVILQKDESIRNVEVPDDFNRALQENTSALSFFNTLSYTHKKEYVQWITGAKKDQPREKRIQDSILMLEKQMKHP